MSHSQPVGAERPGCIVMLLDRSHSMHEPLAGGSGESKAAALAAAADDLLVELIRRSVADRSAGPRHVYDVAAIGYGDEVGPAWTGDLAGRGLVPIDEIARRPTRVPDRDGSAGTARRRPVWIEAAAGGPTPLCAAMDQAGRLLAGWVGDHPTSFPPVVINIGDGAATDGDPVMWSRRLQSLGTDDGPTLVLNVGLSALDADPVLFPRTVDDLGDEYGRTLFEMSSELPASLRRAAGRLGRPVDDGARGLAVNAGTTALASCLRVGIGADDGTRAPADHHHSTATTDREHLDR